jgi:hypothetical protein
VTHLPRTEERLTASPVATTGALTESAASVLARLTERVSGRRLQTVAAVVAYCGFAIYLTWPLAIDLNSRIYGGVGDLTGSISTYREFVESGVLPFAPGTISDFSAPDGLDVRWTLNLLTLPATGTLYLLSAIFGPIPAFGIYTLLGFTLSGAAMFLLVRRLIGHAGVAFVAGFIYAFYPFVVVKAQGHLDFIQGWVLVVPAWRLLELMEHPTRRNGVWAGAALVLAFAWTPYHILFATVIALAVATVALAFAWRRGHMRATLIALTIAGAIGLTWPVAMALVDRAAPHSEVRTNTIQEAVAYSARAAEYVVPTSEHPLFGEQAGEYRSSHLHGSNRSENTLYVGVTVLLLALLGLVAAVAQPGQMRRIALAAAAIAVFGFAFSAPPRVDLLGANLPTPTDFIFNLTTTWRVFSRLVVVVMLGLVLLAALGMCWIVRRRAPALQYVILAVVLIGTAADLRTARAGEGTNKIGVPPSYEALARMPDGIAVEYPLVPAEQSGYGDVFYQGWYDKPILNGYRAETPEENRAVRLHDLSDPRTTRGLGALGVRYLLLRRDLKEAGLRDPGRPGARFERIAEDPYIALYELRPSRRDTLVTPMEGFAPVEEGPEGRFQWLREPEGSIELRGSCKSCAGIVTMTVRNFSRTRNVTVRSPDGTVLARTRVATTKRLRFPVRFSRKLLLTITAAPGPQSIAETVGSPDTRSVSVSVSNESLRLDRGRAR